MSDTTINVKLKGSNVSGGTIELRRFVQFGEKLQKAIDRMAYAIEKQAGAKRKFVEVRQDTSLRLVDIREGSFVAELNFIRPPVLFEDYYDIATDAIKKIVAGLDFLRDSENGDLPDGYDQGVLVVMQELGKVINTGIDAIDFEVKTTKEHITSTYDQYLYTRISEHISEPEEKIAAITGHLLMANFGKEKYRCHLYYEENKYYSCTFDEDVVDDIDNAMRHMVNAIGIATIHPVDDEIMKFHIKKIIVLDEKHVSDQQLLEALEAYIEEHDTSASFRRSFEQILAGEVRPISELWEGIDAE